MTDSLENVQRAFAEAYRIEREVGRGGMATVYLARDLKHDRQVALKVLRPELAAAMGEDRFPREIKIIARLQHPHILPLHDSGQRGGYLFYVMPFVDGESLRARLKREGALPIPEAVRILREVTDALAYAHGRGIIHRDIKPDNVMLSNRHAIVTDFGVAKAVSEASEQKLTTVGVALGTPAYMSPEQAMGESDVDHRSDIYAVGAMAYELLVGAPPFDRPTHQAILSAHVLEEPDDVTTKRVDAPPVLGELVSRCLRKKKEERWQTAEEMLPLLETAATPSAGMTPTRTRPLSAVESPVSRRKLVLAALALVVLGIVGVASWTILGGGSVPGPDRIAVMPIKDISGDDANVIEAMRSQLIGALGAAGLTVAPPSATDVYIGDPRPADEIAQELNVGALLESQVFRAGERLRLTLQLTDPRSIEQIWSSTQDLDLSGDLFDQIDTVVPELTEGIHAAVEAWEPSS